MTKADQTMAEIIQGCIRAVPFDGGVQIEFHACGIDFEAVLDRNGNLREVFCQPAQDQE